MLRSNSAHLHSADNSAEAQQAERVLFWVNEKEFKRTPCAQNRTRTYTPLSTRT